VLRGPPFCMKLTSFVRPALRASSAPTTKNRSRSRAGPLKAGRVLRGHPSGLGLDRPEHGGRISQSGRKRAHSSKFKPLVFGYFHAAANTQRSGSKSEGRFGKQDFVYLADEDVYRCPAGEKLTYRFTAEEHGQKLRGYWTDACRSCPIKAQCTTGKQRRITRWEHGEVVEAVQERLDKNPNAMRTRRETVEHPFATMKMRMGATHFLMKTLPKVATEMALHVLAYNFTRVLNIFGAKPFMAAVRA